MAKRPPIAPKPLYRPFIEHSVRPEYKAYLRKVTAGSATDQDIPHAPYGLQYGPDPQDWDPKTGKFAVTAKQKALPIQGPANWSQIWTDYSEVGTDHTLPVPEHMPLLPHELKYLEKSGESLRDIKFKRVLGEGSFGKVWAVSATKAGDRDGPQRRLSLACKVISLDPSGDLLSDVQMMLEDMHQLSHMNDPHIVNYVDTITVPDRRTGFPFARTLIFMELCDGDLDRLMKDSPRGLHETICVQWLRQIARALRYLHGQRVVHLDIKPANILYQTAKTWSAVTYKLGDFGLAVGCAQRPLVCRSEGRGTPDFVAPEMDAASGRPVMAEPCDVYSLGMSLANTLIGTNTFNDWNVRSIFTTLSYGEQIPANGPPLEPITQYMALLVYYMIERDPRSRVSVDQILEYIKR